LDENREGISRRRLLKGLGAGTAVAWSAPVLMSIKSPAFAQATPRCEPFDLCGQGEFCGPDSACGEGCGGCTVLIDNSCLCWDIGYFCDPDGQTCGSDADCEVYGPNYHCGRINAPCACDTGDDSACWHECGTSGAPRSTPKRGVKVIRA
jgi:hypothetical protein